MLQFVRRVLYCNHFQLILFFQVLCSPEALRMPAEFDDVLTNQPVVIDNVFPISQVAMSSNS